MPLIWEIISAQTYREGWSAVAQRCTYPELNLMLKHSHFVLFRAVYQNSVLIRHSHALGIPGNPLLFSYWLAHNLCFPSENTHTHTQENIHLCILSCSSEELQCIINKANNNLLKSSPSFIYVVCIAQAKRTERLINWPTEHLTKELSNKGKVKAQTHTHAPTHTSTCCVYLSKSKT